MRVLITAAACAALAAISASAQAPVREGLRRTGDAVVEGTGRAVTGAGQITREAGQAAVGAAQTAGQAARSAAGAAVGGVRGGINRLTPAIPLQARAGANLQAADQGREARWRFQRHSGEWWYYSPQNNWMYHRGGDWQPFAAESYSLPQGIEPQAGGQRLANQPSEQYSGEHTMGYRGDQMAAQPQDGGQSRLFVDRCGRHYICENGQRVYVSIDRSEMAPSDQGYQESWSQPTPAEPTPPANEEAQAQPQDAQAQGAPPAEPAPPQPTQLPATPAPEGAQAQPQDQATESLIAPKEERNEPDTGGAQY